MSMIDQGNPTVGKAAVESLSRHPSRERKDSGANLVCLKSETEVAAGNIRFLPFPTHTTGR